VAGWLRVKLGSVAAPQPVAPGFVQQLIALMRLRDQSYLWGSALCETCKHFGGQGCYGLNKEETGDTRYCACCSFGDFDKDTAPMPEWRVTWGNAGGSKGNIYVHKAFGCINHNPDFDPQNV